MADVLFTHKPAYIYVAFPVTEAVFCVRYKLKRGNSDALNIRVEKSRMLLTCEKYIQGQ